MPLSHSVSVVRRLDEPVRSVDALVFGFANAVPTVRGIVEIVDGDIRHVSGASAEDTSLRSGTPHAMGASEGIIRHWFERYGESERQGGRVRFQCELETPLGRRWVSATVAPLVAAGGSRFGYIIEDISHRKEAEAALHASEERERARIEELRAVLDTAPIAIWIAHDPACKEITGNLYADQLMSIPRGGNVSRSVPDQAAVSYHVFRDGVELPPEDLPAQAACITGKPCPEDVYELRFDDGRVIHLLESAVPLFDADGRVRGSVCAGADITPMVEAEAALRKSAQDLAAADQAKSDFLAVLGHELRNPLNSISLAAYLLAEKATGDPAVERSVKTLKHQTEQLSRLVEDLLDISRITRGKLTLRIGSVDLLDAVRGAVDVARPDAEKARQELVMDVPERPITLLADPARLEQVFVNVVSNAVKFTSAGGRIAVSARIEGAEAVVAVEDNGRGIAPDMLPRIFDLFSQGDRQGEEWTGLGIGLALARQLAEMHGGTIAAESAGLGLGSRFTIRLPLP